HLNGTTGSGGFRRRGPSCMQRAHFMRLRPAALQHPCGSRSTNRAAGSPPRASCGSDLRPSNTRADRGRPTGPPDLRLAGGAAPGYADFIGDVGAALRAADLALFVVSAVEGVEVQTEVAWKLAEARGIPRAIFVNKLDRERASFQRTLDQLKERFGAGVAPLHL